MISLHDPAILSLSFPNSSNLRYAPHTTDLKLTFFLCLGDLWSLIVEIWQKSQISTIRVYLRSLQGAKFLFWLFSDFLMVFLIIFLALIAIWISIFKFPYIMDSKFLFLSCFFFFSWKISYFFGLCLSPIALSLTFRPKRIFLRCCVQPHMRKIAFQFSLMYCQYWYTENHDNSSRVKTVCLWVQWM